jgi:hypothetical protein
MNKKILIISISDLKNDPRVNRQIHFLKDDNKVYTLGLKDSEIDGIVFFKLEVKKAHFLRIFFALFTLIKRYDLIEKFIIKYKIQFERNEVDNINYDLVITNDIESLPIAFRIPGKNRILLDAHEYSPEQFKDKFIWRMFYRGYNIYLCKKYLNKVDKMTTVCQAIANEYLKNFNVSPEVITNSVRYYELSPSIVNKDKIKIIHHGAAIPSRKIELMIEMMKHTDERFSLDLMLLPTDNNYFNKLTDLAGKNVSIKEPVPIDKIVEVTNDYDIGLFLLPPIGFNYKYALPNKFFEFIQARLAIAIGPSPEMSDYVKKYDLGIISDDFDPKSLANKINKLTKEKIEHYKNQSNEYAYELSMGKNQLKFKETINVSLGN